MTSYILRKAAADRTGADALVVGVLSSGSSGSSGRGPQIAPGGEAVADAYGKKLKPLLATLGFTGKAGQVATVPTNGVVKSPLLLLVGLGEEATTTAVRRAAGTAARAVTNATSVALALPSDDPALVRAAAEGFALGGYDFDTYRTSDPADRPSDVIVLCEGARRAEYVEALRTAEVVAAAVARTRDWVNTPPGDLTPAVFADAVAATHAELGGATGKRGKNATGTAAVTLTVWDDSELADAGCGGILGVGRGSDAPPRMVRLSYEPQDATAHLALVGKGITYDSGGLSIKPGASMTTMKMDMAGAASVVNAVLAIAELELPVRVTAFAPMAENMISGRATRPGDVLTMYRGKTVEVLNTDAEGRLILADALGHAVEAEPDLVVDVATLTGACMVALGDRVSGLFGNDDAALARFEEASDRAGEAFWHLPIPDEFGEKVRGNSKMADLAQHNAERWGGASYAAAFLREFVDEVPWLHLDIAGPAYNDKSAYGHVTAGGTGVSVATLVELARDLADAPTD
ncbi:leucyl aminopeptidase [Nocardioides sp. HDW12B]|uniref:leucyl aminopeptidase n=1 Tax=Nocardioides sp. HDW12B TaxID=2714939 RepID=UPI00140D976C|nr:leucyl aminopeptidase [Nocardioides sp. HDW12B]QIK66033.1 leucyl aminopeptidase [Nocardioides sp. HDW12B]